MLLDMTRDYEMMIVYFAWIYLILFRAIRANYMKLLVPWYWIRNKVMHAVFTKFLLIDLLATALALNPLFICSFINK